MICSPYISKSPVNLLVNVAREKRIRESLSVEVLTDISLPNLLQGSTDIDALINLFDSFQFFSMNYLPHVHAKIFVFNQTSAIVGSGNFTDGGFVRNFEYAIKIDEPADVQKIIFDLREYSELGAQVEYAQLVDLREKVLALRETISLEQKSLAKKIRQQSIEWQDRTKDSLLRMRVKGKTVNSIFSQTILYLLSRHPMTTQEIHLNMKNIHPDMCDDTEDRIIDGQHFGKLWKHQVRNAQAHLKKAGKISYDYTNRLWRLIA
jgi:hypothetical protein